MNVIKHMLFILLVALAVTGCGVSADQDVEDPDESTESAAKASAEEEAEELPAEEAETEEKNSPDEGSPADGKLDVIDILYEKEEEVLSQLGDPVDGYESDSELYLEYEGLSVTIDPATQEVIRMEIKSDSYLIAGTQLGQSPDDIRLALGASSKDGISDEGFFEMIYEMEEGENQYSIYFAANDFRAPIDYVSIEKAMKPAYTVEEAKELIQGIWILEEFLEEGKLDLLTVIDETYISTNIEFFEPQEEYRITAPDIIEFPTYNSISDEHGWGQQNFEISEDGERLDIYYIDPMTEEIREHSHAVYWRYSDLTE